MIALSTHCIRSCCFCIFLHEAVAHPDHDNHIDKTTTYMCLCVCVSKLHRDDVASISKLGFTCVVVQLTFFYINVQTATLVLSLSRFNEAVPIQGKNEFGFIPSNYFYVFLLPLFFRLA